MIIKEKFKCLDKYEREKLQSLFSIQKNNSLLIKDVVNIIEKEIIIRLRDNSCHSITLIDENEVIKLSNLIYDLRNKNREFVTARNDDTNNTLLLISEEHNN
ncbi:MAG: hypothetical protein ACPKPY_01670 [Nitrososphaeraceae archaeon]